MARHEITMPQLGESVTEGTVTRWVAQLGNEVALDEVLFEVSTDKVDSEIPSPAAGRLAEILVAEGETVDVGTPLCVIDDEAVPTQTSVPTAPIEETRSKVLSPVVRRLIAEHNLDPDVIAGHGIDGRVTRNDVLTHIARTAKESLPTAGVRAQKTDSLGSDGTEAVPFSNIRRRTAEHMVRSKATSPHALMVFEVDFENVERLRSELGSDWQRAEGFALTYLPFVAKAVCDAVREYPHLNASVDGDALVVHHACNLGIAVDLNFEGLVVPVVKDAGTKGARQIAREIKDLADRARSKHLSPDDLMNGTFTITNAGPYGTYISGPIINQPQVAILSTDGVRKRPIVIEGPGGDAIAIRHIGNLSLAWDHRAFDGAYAAAFLRRLKEIIETHDWRAELT